MSTDRPETTMCKVRTPTGYYRENPGAPYSLTETEDRATPVPEYAEYLALCLRGPLTMEAL